MPDGLFNMPTLPIYVHNIRIINFDEDQLAEQQSDADGMPVPIVTDYSDFPPSLGYVALPNPRMTEHTLRVDAVCRVPGDTVVDEHNSMLEVLADQPSGIMPTLVGVYKVFQVRPNPMDLRLLLKRPKRAGQLDQGVQPYVDDPYGD